MAKLHEALKDLPALGPFSDEDVIRRLDDGLVLRRGTASDVEALSAFHAVVLGYGPPNFEPAPHMAAWTRDLAGGEHPYVGSRDFTIVEDTRTRRIASTLALLTHRVCYGGIEIPAGQLELVGTHPDYRRRGLVALQIDEVHRWSEERGDTLQLITGTPWYYRQFGYELALETNAGRVAPFAHLPTSPPPGEYCARAATDDDVPAIVEAYERAGERSLVSCIRDETYARFELTRRGLGSALSREFNILENGQGEAQAVFIHLRVVLGGLLRTDVVETVGSGSWIDVAPWILHHLRESGVELARRMGVRLEGLRFPLSTEHPLYRVAGDSLREVLRPDAWYVRIPDLADFLERIGPVLERRLAASDLAGCNGALAINLFRRGVRLVFERGKLARVEDWLPSTEERGDVCFPDLTFLQLLMGFRSFGQIRDAFPDCSARDERSATLADTLFPRSASQLMLTS